MSEKTIAEKLSIKPGFKVAVVNSPNDYLKKMMLPVDVLTMDYIDININLIQAFVNNKHELDDLLDRIKAHDTKYAAVWVAYPKGDSNKVVNRDMLLHMASERGFRSVGEIDFDDVWSSIHFKSEIYL